MIMNMRASIHIAMIKHGLLINLHYVVDDYEYELVEYEEEFSHRHD